MNACRAWDRCSALAALCVALALSGCGGGGGGTDVVPNAVPVARATGIGQALVGSQVSLDAAGSSDADGDVLRYAWALTERPAGSAAVLSAANTVQASLTPDLAGRYGLTLTVDDGKAGTAVATLDLQVTADALALPDGVAAQAAALSATLDMASGSLQLGWNDSFTAGTRYQVEARTTDGSYRALQTVAGTDGSGGALQATIASATAGDYRVQALLAGRSVPARTAQGATSLAVTVPATTPSIVLDRAEPVSGTVSLSLAGVDPGADVAWFADLKQAGTGATVGWNSVGLSNGTHLLLARLQTAPSVWVEVRRTVTTDNPVLRVAATVQRSGDLVSVLLAPTSAYVLSSVSAVFDGQPLGSLTAPNHCAAKFGCGLGNFDSYRFSVSATAAGSGEHVMQVSLLDVAGRRLDQSVPVSILNVPTITLSTPVDGALLTRQLAIAGSVATDTGTAVTVTATLGDLRVLDASGPGFTGSFDLSGVTAGPYTLTVKAVDGRGGTTSVSRSVVVASSDAVAYAPLFTLGAAGKLLAAEGSRLLYQAEDGVAHVRDTASGADTVLDRSAAVAPVGSWQFSNGRVFVQGAGSDCVASCIYEWAADGSVRNLSNANPHGAMAAAPGRTYDQSPAAKGDRVVWLSAEGSTSRKGSFILYDAARRSYQRIVPPGEVTGGSLGGFPSGGSFDFAEAGGVLRLFHWSRASATAAGFDLHRWDSDTGAITRLTQRDTQDVVHIVQTDGQRVAWSEGARFGSVWQMALRTQPVAGGAVSTVGNAVATFRLADGLLSWQEAPTASIRVVVVETATGPRTLSLTPAAWIYPATSNGVALFTDGGKTYSWHAATARSVLRLDEWTGTPVIGWPWVYFTLGTQQTVYQARLD